MAKRRSKGLLKADKIIREELLKVGDLIINEARPTLRRDTGRLQDEVNFRLKSDTELNLYQMFYGAFNYPRGVNSGEKNALWIKTKELIPEATKNIIKNINDQILKK